MWRCCPLLSWTLRRPVTGAQRKGARRRHRPPRAAEPTRDALGMIIPEARLRRHGPALDAFDRAVEERAQDLLGLHTVDKSVQGWRKSYGAHMDRRDVRFQGRSGDVRLFAELAAKSLDPSAAVPPNAVAFVRKTCAEKREGQDPHETQTKETKTAMDGGGAVLRRALRGSAMADCISASTEPPAAAAAQESKEAVNKKTANAVSEARRRVERRVRRISRAANHDGQLHPCVHQGGCPSRGQPALCPFALHPAAMCAVWLRDGRCDAALNGRCPFWHGSVASTPRSALTDTQSLFPTEADTPGMAALLEMFVDAVVAAVEEAGMQGAVCDESTDKATGEGDDKAMDRRAQPSAVLCAVLQESPTGLPVHYSTATGILYASRVLAASALAADVESSVDAAKPYDEEKRGEQEQEGEDKDNGNEEQEQDGERRLYRVLHTFRGYAVADEAFVSLTPNVTRWVMSRVQQYFVSNEDQNAESNMEYDARELLRGAATELLRCQLEDCNLISCGATAHDGALAYRWAALSLLQHMMLLAHSRSGGGVSLLFTALECAADLNGAAAQRSTIHARFLRSWSFAQTVLSVIARDMLRAAGSGEGLFTITRDALLTVTKQMGQDMQTRYGASLLRAAGWAPWTDAQMFAPQHAAAYSAVSYAQSHQSLFAPAFVVFALNVFLLHALRPAAQFTGGPVGRAFFSPPRPTEKRDALVLSPASLRAALALLSALQDESAAGESLRAALRADFAARRQSHFERSAAEERRQRPRTRRYGPPRLSADESAAAPGGEGSRLDQLLPPGSAAVSPDAVARLIAALRQGKAPYKALRMAASAVRAGRLLRRAAQDDGTATLEQRRGGVDGLVETHRIVHRRVTDSRTGRRRVVRTRERMLRHSAAETTARDPLRPLGLHLCTDAAVLVEATRVGLRMGEAGERLARGVADDCFRGAIADHSRGRCLAVPHAADVSTACVTEESGAVALRTIVAIATGRKEEAARTVRANAKMLEVLVALTPGSTREAHGRYERYAISNPRVLVNERVLLAQQYYAAQHNFAGAGEIAAAIWSDAVRAGEVSVDTRAVHTALLNELYRLPSLEQSSTTLGSGAGLPHGARVPRTVADLREHLEGGGSSSSTSLANPTQSARANQTSRTGRTAVESGGYLSYVGGCVSTAPDASRLRWAVAAGALLALDGQRLGGPQRVWSRLLLRNAFLLAPRTPAYAQATVRVLLTADALREAPTARRLPPWERKPSNGIASFVAAQMRLLTQLEESGSQRQQKCRHAAQRLREVQGLDDANGHAWDLIEPFMAQPELAAIWLRDSFLGAPRELMEWVIAGINVRDKQALISLASWSVLRRHYYNEKNDLVHDRVMKIVSQHCDPARILNFNDTVNGTTIKNDKNYPKYEDAR